MKLSVFQSDTAGLTPTARLQRLEDVAGSQDTDLLLCPELFLSGYAVEADIRHFAEPADGPMARQIADIARRSGTTIVYGYPETDGDRLYNSAQAIAPDGSVLANHRKLVLPPGLETGIFTAGTGLTLFDYAGISFGLLICYDVEFPEAVRATALAGAEALLVPTALGAQWGVVSECVIPSRAFENGIYVAYANHAGREGEIDYFGGSCIVGPVGQSLARAEGDETVLNAILDAKAVAKAQARLPYHQDRLQLENRINLPLES